MPSWIGSRIDQRYEKLAPWDRDKLTRFCEVGFLHFRRQISARLRNYSFDDKYGRKVSDVIREELLTTIMEEMLILQENMIILALDQGMLKRKALEPKKSTTGRKIIFEEEEQ